MKALFSLYFIPFIKKWLAYCALIAFYLFFQAEFGNTKNPFLILVKAFLEVFVPFSPLFFYIFGNRFSSNIKWMINSYYSRSKLMLYHAITQPIVAFLILLPWLFEKRKNSPEEVSLIDEVLKGFPNNTFNYCLVIVIVVYIFPLIFKGRSFERNQLKNLSNNKTTARKSIKSTFYVIFSIILLGVIFSIPFLQIIVGVYFGIIISLFVVIINFNFLSLVKRKKIVKYSLVLMTFAVIGMGATLRTQAKDQQLSLKNRFNAYIELGILAPSMKTKTLERFYLFSTKSNVRDLLDICVNKLDIGFMLTSPQRNSKRWITFNFIAQERRLSPGEYTSLLNFVIKKNKNGLPSKRVLNYIHPIFTRIKLKNKLETIKTLLSADDDISQLIALELIVHGYRRRRHWVLMKPYLGVIKESLVKKAFGEDIPKEYIKHLREKSENTKL